jgi:TolA-binding protein
MRDFAAASDYYGQSYKMKLVNPDYALYQRALLYGVQKKYPEAIADLKSFNAQYAATNSVYTERAKFELANIYSKDNQTDLALSSFIKFTEDYPKSQFMNTALSKIGLIYYNKKDDDKALSYFDKVIKRDRKSAEANQAISFVTDIYTTKGDITGLKSYLGSIGASIPQAALDSLAYGVGMKKSDCKDIVADFGKYIQEFPEGIFIVEANYYKAECDYQMKNMDAALVGYENVVKRNKSKFTEQSLVRASDIYFKKQNYTAAADYYKQLEQQAEDPKNISVSNIGLMRSYFNLKDYPNSILYAGRVLQMEKIGKVLNEEAHYTIAQSYLLTGKFDDAYAEFKSIANNSKSEYGAEAAYNVAYLLFMKNEYKQSEKAVFDFINSNGDYPYWVTKALIVLADDYAGMNDNFQAKTTLKSVINDSDIPELIKIAQEKLDKINAAEEAARQAKTKSEQPLEIQFDGSQGEKKLFNEPTIPEGEKKDE